MVRVSRTSPTSARQREMQREKNILKALETIYLEGNSEQQAAAKILIMNAAKAPHPSHVIRSSDSSVSDMRCIHCSAADKVPGGLGNLALPCPAPKGKRRTVARA